MGFDEEWGRLRAEVGQRAAAFGVSAPPPAVTPDPVAVAREAARERLADFRSSTVLVPLDERGGLWTADL